MNMQSKKGGTCIYCRGSLATTTGKEHVIQQWFGTFDSDTWVIYCVCDECNSFFGKAIDMPFLRDSREGISRYTVSWKMARWSHKNQRIQYTLPHDFEIVSLRWCRANLDHKTGCIELPVPPQLWFWHKASDSYRFFLVHELGSLDLAWEGLSSIGMRLLGDKDDSAFDSIKEIAQQRFGYQEKESTYLLINYQKWNNSKITVDMKWVVDAIIRRAIFKVALNFTAKVFGPEFALLPHFDCLRQFVRYWESDGTWNIAFSAGNDPISDYEIWNSEEGKKVKLQEKGFTVVLENENDGIVCRIQFYDLPTYKLSLARGVHVSRGIWCYFALGEGVFELRKIDA